MGIVYFIYYMHAYSSDLCVCVCVTPHAGRNLRMFGSCGAGGLTLDPASQQCKGDMLASPFPLYGKHVNPCSERPRYAVDPLMESDGITLGADVVETAASDAHTAVLVKGTCSMTAAT